MATGLIFAALLAVCCIPGGIAYAVSDWRDKSRNKKAARVGGSPERRERKAA